MSLPELPALYHLPLWLIPLLYLVLLAGSSEFGFRFGLRRRHAWPDGEAGGGGLVYNATLALLGLMLAFTYSFTVNHYELRKQSVIAESNAIGTAFLRAGLAKEKGGAELRQALLDYARTRVFDGSTFATHAAGQAQMRTSLEAQARLWPATEKILHAAPPGPAEVSLMESVNEVLDMHTKRLAAVFDYLPAFVVMVLLLLSVAAMMMTGYVAGLSGRQCRWRMTCFVCVLASALYVITEFDRPLEGLIQISQRPMREEIASMESDLAGEKAAR
ncbi:MAG: hypothetical protein JNG86_08815 [Verrucomicrobiaceae bacterium]|nr:hypothetical protein [Verrucomicrobiaceae bacterium]